MLNQQQQDFLNLAIAIARNVHKDTGLLVSGQVAQAAQESGWGRKTPGNNCFGIKAHTCPFESGKQDIATHEADPTKVVMQSFAVYTSLENCFRCHALVLRHHFPMAYVAKNIQDYAKSLANDPVTHYKYAADPRYFQNLLAITASHDLTKYDSLILPPLPSEPDILV